MIKAERREAERLVLQERQWGGSIEDCANAAGVDPSTVHRWKSKNARFARQLRQARAKYKVGLIRRVAIKKPEFLLEKQFSSEFGKKVGLEEPIRDTSSFQTTPEEIAERITRLIESTKRQSGVE